MSQKSSVPQAAKSVSKALMSDRLRNQIDESRIREAAEDKERSNRFE